MKLYAYNKKTRTLLETLDALSYDADAVYLGEFTYYPGGDIEISATEDLSQSLRDEWRQNHPGSADRINVLEELLAEVFYGGDAL